MKGKKKAAGIDCRSAGFLDFIMDGTPLPQDKPKRQESFRAMTLRIWREQEQAASSKGGDR